MRRSEDVETIPRPIVHAAARGAVFAVAGFTLEEAFDDFPNESPAADAFEAGFRLALDLGPKLGIRRPPEHDARGRAEDSEIEADCGGEIWHDGDPEAKP